MSFKLDDVSLGRLGRVVLCTVVSLMAAISVMGSFAQGNLKPLLYACVGAVALLAWFAFERYFWPMAVATLFFGGRFSFMPADLSAFQVAMAFGIARFLIDLVAFRKTRLAKGPVIDRLLMAGFFIIFFAHAYDQKLALKVLGSQLWGGRSYVTISFAFVTYFILLTLPYDRKAWRLFPFFVLLPLAFDLCAQLIGMTSPGLGFRLSAFYTSFMSENLMVDSGDAARIGAWSNLGILITISMLAFTQVHSLWRPEKWWALFVCMIGFAFAVLSGYRSAILSWAMVVGTAAVRDFRKAAIVIVPLIATAFLSLVLLNAVTPLPRSVQRGLTFLPGNWDSEVATDAKASLNFRAQIRDQWWEGHFPEHPFFGRGFGYDPIWAVFNDRIQNFEFYEAIIQVGNFHNLKIACLDAVGIFGTTSLFLWCMLVLIRVLTFLVKVPVRSQPPILQWISLYLVWLIVANWVPLGGLAVANLVEPLLLFSALFIKVSEGEGFLLNGKIVVPKEGHDGVGKSLQPARRLEPGIAVRGVRKTLAA